tara:strand:- start:194 stop:817 length:624 start_codon:yes stop_codon:yes gene_type:complete
MSIVKLNNNGVKNASAFGSITGLGSMVLIKKLTASSSSTLSFVDGSSSVVLDNTYKEYLFTFNNMHPDTDGSAFVFGANATGQSGFNETITSTFFRAYHGEGGEGGVVAYETGSDRAQVSDYQRLCEELIGNDNDQCMSGWLRLFNPSDTTFVTNFIAETNSYHASNYTVRSFIAGYLNVQSGIDEIEFKMHTGNIDSGDICLYGIA